MQAHLILWPVLGQVLLTLMVYLHLGRVKFRSVKEGTVDRKRAAVHPDGWPEDVLLINNNIRNQFETPMLFFIMAFALWGLGAVHAISMGSSPSPSPSPGRNEQATEMTVSTDSIARVELPRRRLMRSW